MGEMALPAWGIYISYAAYYSLCASGISAILLHTYFIYKRIKKR